MLRRSLLRRFERPNSRNHYGYREAEETRDFVNGRPKSSSPEDDLRRPSRHRWSFVMQDAPDRVAAYFNDIDTGYVARLACFLGGCTLFFGTLYGRFCRSQEQKPFAQRWSWITPWVSLTLVERTKIPGTKMEVFRFAFPNPADYAGYEPVSSVRLHSGKVRDFDGIGRWFTPISHPLERGFIEFAIKDADPGRMAARLLHLRVGDSMYMGRWMKEYRHQPAVMSSQELGIICTTGGISVALQLAKCITANESDHTRLSMLYCSQSGHAIAFEELLRSYAEKFPKKFRVTFNVLTWSGRKPPQDGMKTTLGMIDSEAVISSMPPAVYLEEKVLRGGEGGAETGSGDGSADASLSPRRSQILVCGPSTFVAAVAGRASPLGNWSYWQGPFYKYGGLLKELGYQRAQVYKFGTSTHWLAYHY